MSTTTAPLELARVPSPRWRWLRPLSLGLALASAIGFVWLGSDAGRAAIARRIEHAVSDGIRGSLTIGHIESLGLDGVSASDVRFLDESGELVIGADHAELALDWGQLLAGRFISRHGRVRGARVVLETLPTGGLALSHAFAPRHPAPAVETAHADAGTGTESDTVRLEGLVASDVEVQIALDGAPAIRVEHVSAILSIRTPENAGTRIRGDRIAGTAHVAAPVPVDLAIAGGTLSFDGHSRRRAVVDVPATVNGASIAVSVLVRDDPRDGVRVEVHLVPADPGAALVDAPLLAQALLAEVGSPRLAVTIDLP